MVTPINVAAALLTLAPFLAVGFFPAAPGARVRAFPLWAQLASPALLSIPYVLVALGAGIFRWQWFALYSALPVLIAVLLWQAARVDSNHPPQQQGPVAGGPGHPPQRPRLFEPPVAGDPGQRGNWRDFLILATLGLAVDLRWFESAWPAHLAIFNKVLLLDAGIYGFVLLRQLEGAGFSLRLRRSDVLIGLREVAFYFPIALILGLALGFLHVHKVLPSVTAMGSAWFFTFFFVAVPEELFFRGWLQNLLTKRMGRYPALILTACLFGLAHFNKRTTSFNWQYVLLAAIAGVFYGRAWMRYRRVGTSAVTHATVDAIWSLWFR